MMRLLLITLFLSNICHPYHYKWHESYEKRKGYALVIHGLNVIPEKMIGIIEELQVSGIKVLNLSLTGHGKNESSELKTITAGKWKREFFDAYKIIEFRSRSEGVPLFFVGFSLGGLLGVNALNTNTDVNFDKTILFAPAIQIRTQSYLLKPLVIFPAMKTPSFTPDEYKANKGLRMAAYKSLYDLQSEIEPVHSRLVDIPTLIFCSEKDSLVSYSGIKEMISDSELNSWTLIPINKNPINNDLKNEHLIIDADSVGAQEWSRISSLMSSFLFP